MTTAAPETQSDKIESLLERVDKLEGTSDVQLSSRNGVAVASYFSEDTNPVSVSGSQMKSLARGRTFEKMKQLHALGYERQVRSFGAQLLGVREMAKNPNSKTATRFAESYEATKKSLLHAFINSGMEEEEAHAQLKAVGMNTYEADHGGSLVLPEFSKDIITRDYDFLDLFARTKQYTVSGNSMTFPKFKDSDRRAGQRNGGIVAKWTGEEETMTESRPAFEDLTLKLNKLSAVVFVTQEMLDDFYGGALGGYVGDIVHDELKFMLGNAIFRGDAIKKPQGIINSPGRVTVPKESGQTAKTLTGTNILEMYRRRLGNKTSKYFWLINQNIETQLNSMQIGASTNAAAQLQYRPAEGLAAAPFGTLMGLPIIPCEFCSPLGTEGDIVLWCPDEYFTITKGGIVEDTSSHVAWLQDQFAYKFTMRADGRLCEDSPITPFQADASTPENDTQSSVITLATRA